MGNADSNEYGDEHNALDKFDGIDTLGYRVLGVQPNSPASSAGLVSFFDFLVGANNKMLLGSGEGLAEGEEYDDVDFPALLRESIGKELELLVWNIKSQEQRLVSITPSNSWGGTGLLGVTIRLDNYAEADERLIRVLSVEHNSPAAIAGLAPLTDYLLGTTSVSFDDDSALAGVLHRHVDRVVEIYVYNTESDIVRVVTLMPTLSWGGPGLLGAEVGTGYIHRLPQDCRKTIGSSVERKVRTGARPTEFQDVHQDRGNSGVQHREELVDLTALTDSVSGTAIHLEPQMEMEPEPEPTKEGNKVEEVEGAAETGDKSDLTANSGPPLEQSGSKAVPDQVPVETVNEVPSEDTAVMNAGEAVGEGTGKQSAAAPTAETMTATAVADTPDGTSIPDAASLFAGPPPDSPSQVVAPKQVQQKPGSGDGQTAQAVLPPSVNAGESAQEPYSHPPPPPPAAAVLPSASAGEAASQPHAYPPPPPPGPPPVQGYAAETGSSYSSTFPPPPPMSHLEATSGRNGDEGVDLR